MASGTFYPAATGDDGYWYTGGFINNGSSSFWGDGGEHSFIRFPSVNIPQGATITTCILTVTAPSELAGDNCNMNVYFEDSNNAVAPTNESEANALSLIATPVAWNAVVHTTVDLAHDSPEIKAALQQVIDRVGWASGNAVMIVMKNNSSTGGAYRDSYDYENGSKFASLYVEWEQVNGVAGSLILPIIQVSGSMINPVRDIVSSISLPALAFSGEVANTSRHISGSLSLPLLSIDLTGTVPANRTITGSVSLPLLSVVAVLSPMTYVTADLEKSIGPVSVVAEGGGYIDTEIYAITISATATYNPVARLDVDLPAITLSATALQEQIASLEKTIPGITISASGVISEVASLSRSIPAVVLTASAIQDHIGTLEKAIGAISLAASAYWMGTNSALLTIPAITLSARAQAVLAEIIALVLNTKNFGLSKYTDYNYNSLCMFNGKVIGGKTNGVYELSGTTDNDGAAISWKLKTGELLLHKNKLREVWLSGKMSGDLKMTVETAEEESYEYDVDSVSTNEDSVRIKVGKGLESEYVTIEFTDTSGETVEIDKIQGFGMKL